MWLLWLCWGRPIFQVGFLKAYFLGSDIPQMYAVCASTGISLPTGKVQCSSCCHFKAMNILYLNQ